MFITVLVNKHVYNSLLIKIHELILKFNNNNVWEIIRSEDDRVITCFKRGIINKIDNFYKYDHMIDETKLATDSRNFNYLDWKSFYGEERLKKLVVDFDDEKSVLPVIYYIKYILGFHDDSKMQRIRSTKWKFWK